MSCVYHYHRKKKSYPFANVLNICLIKAQKANLSRQEWWNSSSKNLYYSFGWRKPPFIGLLAISLIYIMNI